MPVSIATRLPVVDGSHLIHAESGDRIIIDDSIREEQVQMSQWEINNMGIQVVVQDMKDGGFQNISYCDVVGIEPQIWFEKDGHKGFVIVRTTSSGNRNNTFFINKTLLKRLEDFDGFFADVQLASSSPVLRDAQGNVVPLSMRFDTVWLWRGDSFYVNYKGLQKIEQAIKDNGYIAVIDKPSYGI